MTVLVGGHSLLAYQKLAMKNTIKEEVYDECTMAKNKFCESYNEKIKITICSKN